MENIGRQTMDKQADRPWIHRQTDQGNTDRQTRETQTDRPGKHRQTDQGSIGKQTSCTSIALLIDSCLYKINSHFEKNPSKISHTN